MPWNWNQPGWPNFSYDSAALEPLERELLLRSGEFIGAYKHVRADDQENLKIELISEEAVKTNWASAPSGRASNRQSAGSRT